MSRADLARVLGRALIDHDYTLLLCSDPDQALALAGARLTANERAALDDLAPGQFHAAAELLRPAADDAPQPPEAVSGPEADPETSPAESAEEEMAIPDAASAAAPASAADPGPEPPEVQPSTGEESDMAEDAIFDQQQQTGIRLKALEERLAFFDQQQQHTGLARGEAADPTVARLKALEARLAIFDQQQQGTIGR